MEFLHCNACGFIPTGDNLNGDRRRFFLTSCGHVVCHTCLMVHQGDQSCLVCKVQCRCLEISSDSKPDIKSYFLDPLETLKGSIRSSVQIIAFQRSQMKSYSYQVSKMADCKSRLEIENKILREEVGRLKNELDTIKMQHSWKLQYSDRNSQSEAGFLDDSMEPAMASIFGNARSSASEVPQLKRMNVGNGTTRASGLRLSHLGPGRLTLPHTPQKLQDERSFTPQQNHVITPASTFTMYGTPAVSTPDIATRLRQIQCFPKSGDSSASGRRHFM